MDFTGIYNEFQPKIQRYLSQLIGEENAPDLTQTVFFKVSQALDNFRGESSVATWIYQIATNTARDHLSANPIKQKRSEMLLDDDSSVEDFADPLSIEPEREYIRLEMNSCIRGVVEKLPEKYKTVLILSEFEELTNPEISEIVGLPVDTVKIRLHRARVALRKAMECQCTIYHDERNEIMCDRKNDR